MKRYSFFLALAILVVSFGLATANSISLETTTGTWDDEGTTRIVPNATVTYDIRLTNTEAINAGGITNGFRVHSSVASSFGALSGEIISSYDFAGNFDLIWNIVTYEVLKSDGDDTVRFGGSKGMDGDGLLAYHDMVDYRITVADGVDEFVTLCLDSSWYPPTGVWKWTDVVGPVDWDGPHCFEAIMPPCLAPTIPNLPASLSEYHCDAFGMQFTILRNPLDGSPAPPGDLFFEDATHGDIDEFGNWTWAAGIGDVGANVVGITVGNGYCSETYTFTANVLNHAPVLTCPTEMLMTTGSKDFDIVATDDDDCFDHTFTVVSHNLDDAYFNDNVLTIEEADAGDYLITFKVTDGNAADDQECVDVPVTVEEGSDYQIVIDCIGEPSGDVFQGQTVDVPVYLNVAVGDVGGYDLLIAYDNSALSFQSAAFGAEYSSWEYLTYRYGAYGNCGNACPSGLLRVVGIAETNNGAAHPDYFGTGTLFTMKFLVTNDRTFECQNIPLRFYWFDCGDNTLSNREGTMLFLSESILDGYDPLSSTGYQEIFDPTYGFPTYFGAQEECDYYEQVGEVVKQTQRAVSFTNGCVFIACADEIDARGDLNLNNISNEVADAVLYSRYFIFGLGVFDINTQGQIAASDVNADGIALSVADLVYLIRVVIGDALPYPKLAPTATVVVNTDGNLSVRDAMGAAVITIDGNVTPTLLADNMEMIFNYDDASNTTRTLVYSMEANATFSGEFINANGNVTSIELATYEGATVSAKILPGNFELAQNYPNPFNPTTMLAFSIPFASDVTLTIYNITGQKVTEFSGSFEAGVHNIEWDASNQASGIYFYKLNAGNFEETKKMVLLK